MGNDYVDKLLGLLCMQIHNAINTSADFQFGQFHFTAKIEINIYDNISFKNAKNEPTLHNIKLLLKVFNLHQSPVLACFLMKKITSPPQSHLGTAHRYPSWQRLDSPGSCAIPTADESNHQLRVCYI